MQRLRVDADRQAALAVAADVLREGGVVAYPTDTLYGLAVDPRSTAAVDRLFGVKERDRGQAIPLIAADLEQARQAAQFPDAALRLARAFWPGPLSIVVPAAPLLAPDVVRAGTVAVRVPAHAVARELAAAFGFPVTATSANLSGHPPTDSPDAVARALGARIDVLLDAGNAPGGPPSTIVAIGERAPVLVRAGAIAWNRVLEFLE